MAYNIERQAGAAASVANHCTTISAAERQLLAAAVREVDALLLCDDHSVAMVCTRTGINIIDLAVGRTVSVLNIVDADPVHEEIDLTAEMSSGG